MAVTDLLFLPDGKRLVSQGADNKLCLWDTTTGRELDSHPVAFAYLYALALEPDGVTVRVLGFDRALHFWRPGVDGRPAEVRRREVQQGAQVGIALTRDGKAEAVALSPKVRLIDLATGKVEREFTFGQGFLNLLAFSADGRRLAAAGRGLRVWDCRTGRTLYAADSDPRAGRVQWTRLALAADGRSVLVFDDRLRVVEVATGRDRFQQRGVSPQAWSADGRRVACAGNGLLHVYSTATGAEIAHFEMQQGPLTAVAFSRDGRLLASGGVNGTILVWEVPPEPRPAALDDARRAALWMDLGSADAARAFRAMAALADAGPASVRLLEDRMGTRPGPPDAATLARLVADLDSDTFEVREKAAQKLADAGPAAEPALRKALDNPSSPEQKRRARELLDRIKNDGLPPDYVRALRAVEVLEQIGTAEARRVLRGLASKKLEADVAEEVRASLERLEGRTDPRP
jgi:hypothetical protein